jgi:hypothetical protein
MLGDVTLHRILALRPLTGAALALLLAITRVLKRRDFSRRRMSVPPVSAEWLREHHAGAGKHQEEL